MQEVTIIGAGIAGLVLALALHQNGAKCTIYDLSEPSRWSIGGLLIAPNALRILDRLGLYETLESIGFSFDCMEFRNAKDELLEEWKVGSEKAFGYKSVRVARPAFLDMLRKAVQDNGTTINYGKKFSRVVEETSTGVVFELSDGTKIETNILIGADGIHSNVRKYLHPDVVPLYNGQCAIMATIERTFRASPGSAPRPTLFNGQSGAMLVLPHKSDGSQTNLGKQWMYPEQDRQGWDNMQMDKSQLKELFLQKTEEWPECVQDIIRHLELDDFYIWPFYYVPDLPTWSSNQHQRVIILGDSAHTIPPSAGQGACQAIEDAWTLGGVMAPFVSGPNGIDKAAYTSSISDWQEVRRKRVADARLLTQKLGNLRLPKAQRDKLPKEQLFTIEDQDMTWLYGKGRK